MSAKKEDGEINTLVTSDVNTIRINKTGNHLYPVSSHTIGEGLPYAPEDWPNAGDKWGWRAGKRVKQSGYFRDRYLYLPERLRARKDGKTNAFRSILQVEQYVRSEFPNKDINEFFASFSWNIPSKQPPNSKDMECGSDVKNEVMSSGTKMETFASDSHFGAITCKAGTRTCTSLTARNLFPETIKCDICCTEPGFCRDCCCILCGKTISSDYNGFSYIRCEATVVDGYICGHIAHIECALRAYMAGTVGGSIGLDAEYFCRYCDSRTDLVSHALKLLNICASITSYADIEKILNVGICILRGSQKRSAKQLLHRIECTMEKLMNGACIEDVFNMEDSVDITGTSRMAPKKRQPEDQTRIEVLSQRKRQRQGVSVSSSSGSEYTESDEEKSTNTVRRSQRRRTDQGTSSIRTLVDEPSGDVKINVSWSASDEARRQREAQDKEPAEQEGTPERDPTEGNPPVNTKAQQRYLESLEVLQDEENTTNKKATTTIVSSQSEEPVATVNPTNMKATTTIVSGQSEEPVATVPPTTECPSTFTQGLSTPSTYSAQPHPVAVALAPLIDFIDRLAAKVEAENKMLEEQNRMLEEQNKMLEDCKSVVENQTAQIIELTRRISALEQKLMTMISLRRNNRS